MKHKETQIKKSELNRKALRALPLFFSTKFSIENTKSIKTFVLIPEAKKRIEKGFFFPLKYKTSAVDGNIREKILCSSGCSEAKLAACIRVPNRTSPILLG